MQIAVPRCVTETTYFGGVFYSLLAVWIPTNKNIKRPLLFWPNIAYSHFNGQVCVSELTDRIRQRLSSDYSLRELYWLYSGMKIEKQIYSLSTRNHFLPQHFLLIIFFIFLSQFFIFLSQAAGGSSCQLPVNKKPPDEERDKMSWHVSSGVVLIWAPNPHPMQASRLAAIAPIRSLSLRSWLALVVGVHVRLVS